MSRDPHPAEAGGVPRPRRRARIAGPWYHSPKAALSGLAVLIAWGLLLPGATPVGGGMSTLGSLSLFGYALFSIVGGIVFLSNRNLGRVLSSCAAVGLLLLWGWLFVRYSGADWSRLAYVFFNFEILGESGMKALAGGFMTTLEVGIIATLCAFWLGVFLTLVRFFENKVMTGFVKVYVDVFRALPTIVLVSLIHYGAPFIGIYLPLMVSGILTLTLNHSAFLAKSCVRASAPWGMGSLRRRAPSGSAPSRPSGSSFSRRPSRRHAAADRAVRGAASRKPSSVPWSASPELLARRLWCSHGRPTRRPLTSPPSATCSCWCR